MTDAPEPSPAEPAAPALAAVWSFADEASGQFSGASYAGPADALASNTPPGHVAVPGLHDHLATRLDVATGQVLPWQPPAPPDTELHTWAWHAQACRWVPAPTLQAQRLQAIAQVQQAILAREVQQQRPVREILAAQLQGQAPSADTLAAFAGHEAAIAALRQARQAMQAATTLAQLQAITYTP